MDINVYKLNDDMKWEIINSVGISISEERKPILWD